MVDDIVWLDRTPSLSSASKLEARWVGPLKISDRVGEHTYQVLDKRGTATLVHIDQLKPYEVLGEVGELVGIDTWGRPIANIQDSRKTADGVEYMVRWGDLGGETQTWVPHDALIAMGAEAQLMQYLRSPENTAGPLPR